MDAWIFCGLGLRYGRGIVIAALGIVAMGVCVRVAYLSNLLHTPAARSPVADAEYNDAWARAMVDGDWARSPNTGIAEIPKHAYYRQPGYALFLSAVYRLCGPGIAGPRVAQALLGVGSIIAAFLIGLLLGGRVAGLASAAFMATHWSFVYFEGELVEAGPVVFLDLMVVLLCMIYRRTWARSLVCVAGGLLGLRILMRPTALLIIPVVMTWIVWVGKERRGWRRELLRGAMFAVFAFTAIAPVTLRNWHVGREFVPVSANAGIVLHMGNADGATGAFVGVSEELGVYGATGFYTRVARGVLGLADNEALSMVAADRWFRRRAIDYMLKHPLATSLLWLKKAWFLVGPMEVGYNRVIAIDRVERAIVRKLPFPHVLVLGLGAVGVFVMAFGIARRLRVESDQRIKAGVAGVGNVCDAGLVLVWMAVVFVGLVPFFATSLYRQPILPWMGICGAVALSSLVAAIREQKWGVTAGIGFGTLVVMGLSSMPWIEYRPNKSKWLFDEGLAHERCGDSQKAVALYRDAFAANRRDPAPLIAAARVLSAQGAHAKAITLLNTALSLGPRDPASVHGRIGVLLIQTKDFEGAAAHLQRAMALDPRTIAYGMNAGLALVMLGDMAKGVEVMKRSAIRAKGDEAVKAAENIERVLRMMNADKSRDYGSRAGGL